MSRISSKLLNLVALEQIIKASNNLDGVTIFTNFGYVIGTLATLSNDDNNIVNIISNTRNEIIESSYETKPELVGDGSLITINNATVKYPNGSTFKTNELTLFADSVLGFVPCNVQETLSQL